MDIKVQMTGQWDGVVMKAALIASMLKKAPKEIAEQMGDAYIEKVRYNASSGKMGSTKQGTTAWYRSGTLMDKLSKRWDGNKLVAGALTSVKYKDGVSVADVASWLEYGTKRGINPRPLFLMTVKEFFEDSSMRSMAADFGASIQKAWIK